MSWYIILTIIIGVSILVLTPLYYLFFNKDDTVIVEGNPYLKKQLVKMDRETQFICVFNHEFEIEKGVSKKVPAIVISNKSIYVFFTKTGEFNKETIGVIKKIKDKLEKAIDQTTEIAIIEKTKVPVDLHGISIPWIHIKGYNSKKMVKHISTMEENLSSDYLMSQNRKRDILEDISKMK